MKIGFIDRSDASWTAGASYTRSVTHALASAMGDSDELFVLAGSEGITDLPSKAQSLRVDSARLTSRQIEELVIAHGIDVVLPVTELLTRKTPAARIGWIPDFQHCRLPHYYNETQRQQRDVHFQRLIDESGGMMFSSHAVRNDFLELYPDFPGLSACIPFPSSLAYRADALSGDPGAVRGRCRLPSAYALVVNQFWRHKNHRVVVEAVAEAKARCPEIVVAMVGMLSDSRDVSNAHISGMLRQIFTEDLAGNVRILGEVSDEELICLLRGASLIIQPSEFEGWSTTVQDAVALGKSLACSDLPVHREQAPSARFFGVRDARALAEILVEVDWRESGWSGIQAETAALETERKRAKNWGADLIAFCREVVEQSRKQARLEPAAEFSLEHLKLDPAAYAEYLEQQVRRLEGVEKALRQHNGDLHGELERLSASAAELRNRIDELSRLYHLEKTKPLRRRVSEALRSEWRRLAGRSAG